MLLFFLLLLESFTTPFLASEFPTFCFADRVRPPARGGGFLKAIRDDGRDAF